MRNALTRDEPTLFISQYGQRFVASTAADLKRQAGYSGGIKKQFVDKPDGRTVWNGYVIGRHWFTAFKWQEVEQ